MKIQLYLGASCLHYMLTPAPPSHLAALSFAGCAPLSRGYQVTLQTTPAHPRWISETASDQRPWMVLLHRGTSLIIFNFHGFLMGRLRVEIMDAKVLPKIRKVRRTPEFSNSEFFDFLAWRTRQTGTVCVRPYKPYQAPHWHSATASRRVNTFRRRTLAGTERSQLLWNLPNKTVR